MTSQENRNDLCEHCFGTEFDLEANTISLPLDKLLASLLECLDKSVVTEHQLASHCGRLLHAASVVRAGRSLTHRILAAKSLTSTTSSRSVFIDDAVRAGIKWWISALRHRNVVYFLEHSADLVLSMDASSNSWGVLLCTGEYWHSPPPQEYLHPRIEDLELLYHLVCCNIWASQWSSKLVQGKTDNKRCFIYLKTE